MFEESSRNYKGAAAVAEDRQRPRAKRGAKYVAAGSQATALKKIQNFKV